MAFCSGPAPMTILRQTGSQLKIAVSKDLYHWERLNQGRAVFSDFCLARDPMLLRHGGEWAMFYCRCNDTRSEVQGVAVRRSKDLVRWSEPTMALITDDRPSPNSGSTESPFVFSVNGTWYMTVCAADSLDYPSSSPKYMDTRVHKAVDPANPFLFEKEPVGTYWTHAAEWFQHDDGRWWMTSAGWEQNGTYVYAMSPTIMIP